MPRLRIIAEGVNSNAQANARGHLFEGLISTVLRSRGFEIDRIPSVNYAGMEIDIEGHDALTDVPLYAECKCYDTPIDCPKIQAFYGKYMTRWINDRRSQGLFLAIPTVNSHARGFYNENCRDKKEITVSMLDEDAVLQQILRGKLTVGPELIGAKIAPQIGTPGDQILLYSDHGWIWVQFVVPKGGAIADRCVLFDAFGNPIVENSTVDYVRSTCPDVSGFEIIAIPSSSESVSRLGSPSSKGNVDVDTEQVVEVRGSSAWFEYQFPASPEYFVGRVDVLKQVRDFAEAILAREISARGLLFTGNSGWGKSSAVLAAADGLQKQGHRAVVIDSRSISSARSVLRVFEYGLRKLTAESGDLFSKQVPPLTGFDGAASAALSISEDLKSRGRVAFLFLDQFENVFFLPEALRRIRDFLFKMCDSQAHFVVGFAWKSDLIGATNDFPFHLRDAVADVSKRISLETFSDVETNALLDKLKSELRTNLRRDLRFFLSEFSQGFPWLLKKLCAHVKAQREAGVVQSEIANRLLNVEQLFKEDIGGLTVC